MTLIVLQTFEKASVKNGHLVPKSRGTNKLNRWEYKLIARLREIIELNHRIEGNGIYIVDIMHVFEANNPASQLESKH